jgi:hypothetical protein
MSLDDHLRRHLLPARAHVMNHDGVRHVDDSEPGELHAAAPVHVLVEHEEGFVHWTDALDRGSSNEQERTRQPVDFTDRGVIPIAHEIAARVLVVREEPCEQRVAVEEERHRIGKRTRRVLEHAICALEPRTHDRGPGMVLQVLDQLRNRARTNHAIRVHDEHELARGRGDALVHRAREADVFLIRDAADVRKLFRDPCQRPVLGSVCPPPRFRRPGLANRRRATAGTRATCRVSCS